MEHKRGNLTKKQARIAQLICEQKTTKEIAHELGICKRTVESIKAKIMFEIEAKNSVGIAIYAIKNKIWSFENSTVI